MSNLNQFPLNLALAISSHLPASGNLNNPGLLRTSCLKRIKMPGGLIKFLSPAEGLACLVVKIAEGAARGFTLAQYLGYEYPTSLADLTAQISSETGIHPDAKLLDLYPIVPSPEVPYNE